MGGGREKGKREVTFIEHGEISQAITGGQTMMAVPPNLLCLPENIAKLHFPDSLRVRYIHI